jgi:hypothetical protein
MALISSLKDDPWLPLHFGCILFSLSRYKNAIMRVAVLILVRVMIFIMKFSNVTGEFPNGPAGHSNVVSIKRAA